MFFRVVGQGGFAREFDATLIVDGNNFNCHFLADFAHVVYRLDKTIDRRGNRPERKEEWGKKFGEYIVLHLGDDEMTSEELLKRNKEFYKNKEDDAFE